MVFRVVWRFLAADVFLIVFTLDRGCFARADQSNPACAGGEANQNETVFQRVPDDDLTRLVRRVLIIVENPGQRVPKNRERLFEVDSMTDFIGTGLSRVPLK